VSQLSVLTASGALPTIKIFFNLGFMELLGCFDPIVDFANDTVMNFTLREPSL